ncbi:hypothetical protein FOH24_01500 [Acetobacter tropicalis]|uniref:Cell surface protein n=1 Tax=Acetobacter tropicalis TaxID=104102 RepID=A0A094YVD4_9PROT|nr:hypothetical protein [Acetobacter tropicalis]KAA8389898.1 hypothetical protein FOH22_03170 [Acetobacter tropicalis]KAA8392951.1 hypothetical protein FOH24_01500 [Acetobacter tropicalis]KGB25372.1 cell surface protein [Acetobacter tropicalis]MBC9007986.1 hypothetical protein [Acetobacter tropicalis]MDO8172601.1 hypothetical protein [Acetobacter tropicalis]
MIPCSLLSHALGYNIFAVEQENVPVPHALLLFLVQQYMAHEPFNEASYLHANPDVALAVGRGEFSSGQQHFLQRGYQEEREGHQPAFSEHWYLQQNPDVAIAVQLGDWPSGQAHYQTHGKTEWRSPSPQAQPTYALWQRLLSPCAARTTPSVNPESRPEPHPD